MKGFSQSKIIAIACAVATLTAAEITARFDDWVRFRTAIWASPDNGVDLRIADTNGVRGRPYGHHQQFELNNFGFRASHDHSLRPSPSCVRIMTLGASETLGLLEPPGEEYPAQLERVLLATGACYEVLNSAVAGMALPSIEYTWSHYWKQFQPQFVVVYPSPTFYLGEEAPASPDTAKLRTSSPPWPQWSWQPRLVHRAREAIEFPAVIQRIRVRRRIEGYERSISRDSLWTEAPEKRLALFRNDLESLVGAITATGATPVLLTHARRFPDRLAPEDNDLLQAWRSFSPRATTNALVQFDKAASLVTIDVAKNTKSRVVNVDCHLSGLRELFGDHVHFTAEGSRRVAELIAATLTLTTSDAMKPSDERCENVPVIRRQPL